jgi:predicted RNA polymerase sigma factor
MPSIVCAWEAERFTNEIDRDSIQLDELVSRPDTTLEHRDQVALVRQALARLAPTYREPVALRDVHDLSYEEIAEPLQLPEGTVKSRIARGRKELARHLQILQEHVAASAAAGQRSADRQHMSYAARQDEHWRHRSAQPAHDDRCSVL